MLKDNDCLSPGSPPERHGGNMSAKRTGLTVIAAFFLLDPFFGGWDFLPDLVGWLLLCAAFSPLTVVSDDIDDACKKFRILAGFSAARYVCMFIIERIFTGSAKSVPILLMTFSLFVCEMICECIAFNKLKAGLSTVCTVEGGIGLLSGKPTTDSFCKLSVAFFAVKGAMALLPELTVLFHTDSGSEGLGIAGQIYNYVTVIRVLCGLAVLVFGLIWLISTIRLQKRIKKDPDFISGCNRALATFFADYPNYCLRRDIASFTVLVGAALFLCTDFFIDGYHLTPDALCAAVLAVALFRYRRLVPDGRKYTWVTVLLGADIPLSLFASHALSISMHRLSEYGGEDYSLVQNASMLFRNPGEWREFLLSAGLFSLSKLLILASVAFVIPMLCRLVDLHTEADTESDGPREPWRDSHNSQSAFFAKLKKRMTWVIIAALFGLCHSVAYIMTLPYAYDTPLEWLGGLDIPIHIITVIFYYFVMKSFLTEVDYRYRRVNEPDEKRRWDNYGK